MYNIFADLDDRFDERGFADTYVTLDLTYIHIPMQG